MFVVYSLAFFYTTILSTTCATGSEEMRPSPLQLNCAKNTELGAFEIKKRKKKEVKTRERKRQKVSSKNSKSNPSVVANKPLSNETLIHAREANDLETVKEMKSCWGEVQQAA
ncbi:hypothetical protein Y032_0016g2914 [Ancylostoma ceylanicum]|nr:hypothetical protein Y032_0016g2914 [Ancylostoma ceylanicum]